MIEIALVCLCLTLVLLPPQYDPAILIKERQGGFVSQAAFRRNMRRAILPATGLWALTTLIGWAIFAV